MILVISDGVSMCQEISDMKKSDVREDYVKVEVAENEWHEVPRCWVTIMSEEESLYITEFVNETDDRCIERLQEIITKIDRFNSIVRPSKIDVLIN